MQLRHQSIHWTITAEWPQINIHDYKKNSRPKQSVSNITHQINAN